MLQLLVRSNTNMANIMKSTLLFAHITNFDVSRLMEKKQLPVSFFSNEENSVDSNSGIDRHVAKVFNIYACPYKENQRRVYHGIAHVSRVAFYIPILIHFYKRYSPTISISPDDIKLLQLAALFHDSGREREEEDKWDLDSASFLYYYLTFTLKINKEKSREFAEAIANKDYAQRSISIPTETLSIL